MSNPKILSLYAVYIDSIKDKADGKIIENNKKEFETELALVTDFTEKNEADNTLLWFACVAQDINLVKHILSKIPKFDLNTDSFVPELHAAVLIENKEIIRLLLNHGAKIDQQNSIGYTTLGMSILTGEVSEVKLLLELGANIAANNALTKELIIKTAFSSEAPYEDKMLILNTLFLWAWSRKTPIDLSNIEITSNLTEHLFMFDVKNNGNLITQKEPEFMAALTSSSDILNTAKLNIPLDYENIYLAVKYRIENGDNNKDLHELANTLKRLWQRQEMLMGMSNGYIFHCANNMTFYNQEKLKHKITEDLDDKIKALAEELAIKLPSSMSQ